MAPKYKIVLASQSPRRRDLLNLLGVPFLVIPSRFDEDSVPIKNFKNGLDRAIFFARSKALDVKAQIENDSFIDARKSLIISCDTLVECYGDILEKPRDINDAKKMLKSLSDKRHHVHSAVTIVYKVESGLWEECHFHSTSTVFFHPISDVLLDKYLQTKDSLDKAGAYGLQGLAQCFVKEIQGNYSSIIGLPIDLVERHLANIFKEMGMEKWWEYVE